MRQRKTNIVWFHLHGECEKTNEQIQQNRVTDTKNKQVTDSREALGAGKKQVKEWEVQTPSCKINEGRVWMSGECSQ